MPLIIPGNVASATASTGYDVDHSLRWDDGDSPVMSESTGTPSDPDKWTYSVWVKRCTLGAEQKLIALEGDSLNNDAISFDSSDQLRWYGITSSSTYIDLKTNRKFRDVGAWYNLCFVYDSAQGTDSDRAKIYVNGTQETSLATSTYPAQNKDSYINTASKTWILGRQSWQASGYFDGYMSEIVFCDGQAYAPDGNVGEFNGDSPTIFQPKDPSGLTFGTNGFFLEFKETGTSQNSSGIGADTSGNNNHFAVTNLAAIDQANDSPTNNFCTLNPLAFENAGGTGRMSEGSLRLDGGSSTAHNMSVGTIAVNQGKWWFEAEIDAYGGNNPSIGIASYDVTLSLGNYIGGLAGTIGYTGNGNINENGSNLETGLNSYTDGDIINIGLDLDNNKIYAYKNGSLENTGGTTITNRYYSFAVSQYSNSGHWLCNFGASAPYTISSGNADENGYGNFEHAPVSGYLALCTKNLAEEG